jgi:glycosyltransferase involved in cell wall biosynthesis
MKVTISVGGRWHAFYLAQQLVKRNYLENIITSYPKGEVVKYGIPRNLVRSIIIMEAMRRLWGYLPGFLTTMHDPNFLFCELFDKLAAANLHYSDLVVAWSSFGLQTLRKAKSQRATTVVERGSSHIVYQNNIIREEHAECGLKFPGINPYIMEKELQEYDEADYIAVPSLFVKRTFLEQDIPENKLLHVPYGVHINEFPLIPKKDNNFRVIYAGALSIRKGIVYLLQAFSELNLPNSELLLIGGIENNVKPILNKYQGNFQWIGHVPQKELFEYYANGSVFVIMSVEEGLAMVQPQAMAAGLPVICTTNTGGEDLLREGIDGFVIPIRDVEALKDKLLYLYENPEICRAMGESAHERIKHGYSWDDYGARIIENYERIVAKKQEVV